MDLDLFGVFDGKQKNPTENEKQETLSSTVNDNDEKSNNANEVVKGPSDKEPQRAKFTHLEERTLGKRAREEVGGPAYGFWCCVDIFHLVLVVWVVE